jgi:hypothetical protein
MMAAAGTLTSTTRTARLSTPRMRWAADLMDAHRCGCSVVDLLFESARTSLSMGDQQATAIEL